MTKVIYEQGGAYDLGTSAREDHQHLWVTPSDLQAATGWVLKPEGLCRGDACIPLRSGAEWTDAQGRIDLAAFARFEGRPMVRDAERGVWAFGPVAQVGPPSVQAPDFTFPDIDGKPHSLSDYRGRRPRCMCASATIFSSRATSKVPRRMCVPHRSCAPKNGTTAARRWSSTRIPWVRSTFRQATGRRWKTSATTFSTPISTCRE